MKILQKKTCIIATVAALFLLGMAGGLSLYRTFAKVNIQSEKATWTLNIYPDDDFESLLAKMQQENMLLNEKTFRRAARRLHYPEHIRSGHYELSNGMNNRILLKILGQGLQKPVRIHFNNLRSLEQLASVLSKQVMADSAQWMETFLSPKWTDSIGFTAETIKTMFLPDTYEVWWNASPDRIVRTFYNAYQDFWNEKRLAEARKIHLSPIQVGILASIIEEESNLKNEWPIIAGLYLNRLKKNMYLQACPTVKYALNDFSIHRVLKEHTLIDSPYNTYQKAGLPPGPIRIPSKEAQEAVLNAQANNYLYMCAKDDFSGGHYFSSKLSEHNRYAERYHRALNRHRIMH